MRKQQVIQSLRDSIQRGLSASGRLRRLKKRNSYTIKLYLALLKPEIESKLGFHCRILSSNREEFTKKERNRSRVQRFRVNRKPACHPLPLQWPYFLKGICLNRILRVVKEALFRRRDWTRMWVEDPNLSGVLWELWGPPFAFVRPH